jgi:hypothetical protein
VTGVAGEGERNEQNEINAHSSVESHAQTGDTFGDKLPLRTGHLRSVAHVRQAHLRIEVRPSRQTAAVKAHCEPAEPVAVLVSN